MAKRNKPFLGRIFENKLLKFKFKLIFITKINNFNMDFSEGQHSPTFNQNNRKFFQEEESTSDNEFESNIILK